MDAKEAKLLFDNEKWVAQNAANLDPQDVQKTFHFVVKKSSFLRVRRRIVSSAIDEVDRQRILGVSCQFCRCCDDCMSIGVTESC
jgi:hypothetical protein